MTMRREKETYAVIKGVESGLSPLPVSTGQTPLASTTSPLKAAGGSPDTYTSPSLDVRDYSYLIGTCYADKDGLLTVRFSSDGVNWDGEDDVYDYKAGEKLTLAVFVAAANAQVEFENKDATDQSVFRLYISGKYS